jgi:predicted transcriptional regulator
MKAFELITHEIPPLRPSDPVGRALEWMAEFKVGHLPVVDGKRLLGTVKDSQLVERNDLNLPVGDLVADFDLTVAGAEQHVFDVVQLFGERNLSIVPVVDDQYLFQGTITEHDALDCLVKLTNIAEPGSIVVLELNTNDYSLFEIARLVEGNDMKILGVTTEILDDPLKMQVTIKIDQEDISPVLQTFDRYDYVVRSSHKGSDHHEYTQDRYEELMRFLNM